ncbi:MAG: HisA/HisF-related TIM barrel protein [Acidimicrobiia bacterium]
MECYPAIDVREGRSVRLHQGAFAEETRYDEDPVALAAMYAQAGAPWVHIVDLDAARTGVATQRALIAAIRARCAASIQVGGGVRSRDDVVELLDAGVTRVVLGTIAVEAPEIAEALLSEFGAAIAIGLDARCGVVATRGWEHSNATPLLDWVRHYDAFGPGAFVVTEIGRDGTFAGPDLEQLAAVLKVAQHPLVASGGVGSLDDLRALAELRVDGRGLAGAIVGRALSEAKFSITDALGATRNSAPHSQA